MGFPTSFLFYKQNHIAQAGLISRCIIVWPYSWSYCFCLPSGGVYRHEPPYWLSFDFSINQCLVVFVCDLFPKLTSFFWKVVLEVPQWQLEFAENLFFSFSAPPLHVLVPFVPYCTFLVSVPGSSLGMHSHVTRHTRVAGVCVISFWLKAVILVNIC